MEIKGRVALVTGGARIGKAVAARLADSGVHLALTYCRSKMSALASIRYAEQKGVRAIGIQANLLDPSENRRVINEVLKCFGRLDFLIHLASVYDETPLSKVSAADLKKNFEIHVSSVFGLTVEASRAMNRRRGGRVILFGDWTPDSGRPTYKNYLPYYVSKRAASGLAESLALELAPRILVNTISPGPIIPPANTSARLKREVVNATPLGKWGGADEVAKTVIFLLETDFITGECIRVDGGRHLR